jgi:hypothetical protein
MKENSLDTFFDAVVPFLHGSSDAPTFATRVGASRSGARRVAIYPRNVALRRVEILDALFLPLRRAWETQGGVWAELVSAYFRDVPSCHWNLNETGAAFADFLERRAASGTVPSSLAEMADYLWIRHRAYRATTAAPDAPSRIDVCVFVRQYEHDVIDYVQRARAGEPLCAAEPRIVTAIVFRHVEALDVRVFLPSAVALQALAQLVAGRTGEAAGIRELVRAGVVGDAGPQL